MKVVSAAVTKRDAGSSPIRVDALQNSQKSLVSNGSPKEVLSKSVKVAQTQVGAATTANLTFRDSFLSQGVNICDGHGELLLALTKNLK